MYDVICESVKPDLPGEKRGGGDRIMRGVRNYVEAQRVADDYVIRFGHLPDVRVLIWDAQAQRTITIHDATDTD